jgi:hypothetical protein
MPVTALLFGNAFLSAAKNALGDSLDGHAAVKASLHTNTWVPDQDADVNFSDLSDELVDASYPAGGVACTNVTVTRTNLVTTLDCDPIVFNNLSGTFRYMVLRDATTGVAATEPVLAYINFGGDVVPAAQDFTVTPHASGIATFTAA